MKMNIKKSAIPLALLVVLMMSCVGDLNVKPIDPYISTSADVYTTPESYKAVLAKLYASFALTGQIGPAGSGDVAGVDEGFSCFIRSLWNMQELTTDEAVNILDSARKAGIETIKFTGGEPLLREDIIEIIAAAATSNDVTLFILFIICIFLLRFYLLFLILLFISLSYCIVVICYFFVLLFQCLVHILL